MPDALLRKLAEAAASRGVPKSTIIRESLETALAKHESKKKVSCLDLVRHLVGTIEGPLDASTNPRYLEEAAVADSHRGKKKPR